jgi:hypothetical protein
VLIDGRESGGKHASVSSLQNYELREKSGMACGTSLAEKIGALMADFVTGPNEK